MRITVSGPVDSPLSSDTYKYAEYRVFSSIAPHGTSIHAVDVVVRRTSPPNRSVLCTVVVDLGPSGRLRTQAVAPHPSAAIDRAADRAGWLVRRRAGQNSTSKSAGFSS
jgi:hypothetical protein